MTNWRGGYAKLSPRLRRLVRIALGVMAAQILLLAARVAEFLFGAPAVLWVPTSLLIFAFAAGAFGVCARMRSVRIAESPFLNLAGQVS